MLWVAGLWVGVLLMALAACWLPLLLYADFLGSHSFRLLVSGTAAAGLALAFIQPPFPFQVLPMFHIFCWDLHEPALPGDPHDKTEQM